MLPSKDLVAYFFLLWIVINGGQCQNIEEMSKTLDQILVNTRSFRRPRDHEDASLIWQQYEFDTGVGNREDVVVTNISSHTLIDIPENIHWHFSQTETVYFLRVENSTLLFYELNLDDLSIKHVLSIITSGQILKFKILNLNIEETFNENRADDLMAVLFVEFQGYFLYWYKISGNTYTLYSKLSVQKQIQDMEFVQEENQHELLILYNDTYYEEQTYIDIYSFTIDHYNPYNRGINIWHCQRLFIPKIFDVQICSIYGRAVLAFQQDDNVILYESKKEDKLCQFEKYEVIKFDKLTNFVCFESGYIKYLAIGGKKLRLFRFFEDEFKDNVEMDLHFNESTEISWVTAIPLNTYRDESLLLVQLKNSTVIALAWHGSKYKTVSLPNRIMDNFNLSKIIAIPKIGFIHTNMLVRVKVALRELAHPIYNEMESMLKTQALLEEVFRKQEAVFDETETRFNQSYLKSPMITGFWNLSIANVLKVTIEDNVNYGTVKAGSVDLGMEDISTNATLSLNRLEKLKSKLNQIYNLKNTNSTKINLPFNVELTGNFLINSTLHAKNVTAAFINDASISIAANDNVNCITDIIKNGEKSFPPINTDNLITFFLNGVPLNEIIFDTSMKNYSNIDFAKLKRLKVCGHLNFSELNNVQWENLMQNIVWKDKSAIIFGETIVEGELIADESDIKSLNYLQYPEDYVLSTNKSPINVTGEKYFTNLSTTYLLDIDTINEIDIGDFIILNKYEVLNHEIIFENLEISGQFQIDGNVTGLDVSNIEDFVNETDKLLSDVIFENLIIEGNIVLQDSIDAKTWSDFDNILLKTEENAVITGNKHFLNNVTILFNAMITSEQINGHALSEFMTLNTDQHFPYLKKISADVTFGNVTLNIVKKLENYIINEKDVSSSCSDKILWFMKSPIVDDLSFDTLQQTISWIDFFKKLNQTFKEAYYENLTLSTLIVNEVLPNIINDEINYADLAERVLTRSTQQNVTGDFVIDNLEIDILHTEVINNTPLNDLNRSLIHMTSFNHNIFNGNVLIRSLQVTGMITASSINENNIIDLYKEDSMGTVIFNNNISIKDLTVNGFLNGMNLSEFIADSVRKIDKNVTFTGRKIFENITCEFLESWFINENFVDDILDADKAQVLKGPVVVNSLVTVLRDFNTTGKIGDVQFRDFTNRFEPLQNNSYALRGDFYFTENSSIINLDVNGTIQGELFDTFLQRIILKNNANITISGSKLFKGPVTFNNKFTIDGSLNDLDLYKFHKCAVYIDKPFSINSKIVFKENVYVRKDLVINTKLQSNTIMGVNVKSLQENVIALNEPISFPARITLNDVNFESDIKVVQVNDLQMNLSIPLHTKQLIDRLNCINVTAKNIQILGRINAYDLKDIYTNTFMMYGNQNFTGYMKIRGNVYAYHDFNAHLINNFSPKRIISLTANDTLIGNFIFKTPVILDKNLRILNLLNEIRPINWQGIMATDETKQIVFGKWKVYGNVHFKKNITGSKFLNEIDVASISTGLAEEHPQIDVAIEGAYNVLHNICAEKLDMLKCNAAHQIYKFDTFDYLKILKLKGNIHDIHYVELNDLQYVLINYDTCRVQVLLYTQIDFQVVDDMSDFGLIDQWTFFKSIDALYLHTTAKHACDRSLNNIWKLENNRLVHVFEFDNFTDLYQDVFVTIMQQNIEAIPEDVQSNILEALISYDNERVPTTLQYSISNNDPIESLTNQSLSYDIHLKHGHNCSHFLNFKVGIYEKEEYIYYNEEVSQDYIFICKNDTSQTKILQTIKAHRPKSLLVLNFDGFVETLLIFAENDNTIKIYEYRGIEGFVYRNALNIKVDKIYTFKLKKYTNLEKRHCLAIIHENQLTILEAKMYGEKLDWKTLATDNSC